MFLTLNRRKMDGKVVVNTDLIRAIYPMNTGFGCDVYFDQEDYVDAKESLNEILICLPQSCAEGRSSATNATERVGYGWI